MFTGSVAGSSHLRNACLAIALACAVAGCEAGPGAVDVAPSPDAAATHSDLQGEPDYVAPARATPGFGPGAPGLRLLPNQTALQGDNFVLVRPQRGFGGVMTLEARLRAAGALPAPFEYAIAQDFRPVGGGALSYVEAAPEAGVTCVLVLGPSGAGYGRPDSLMMRNCVNGDAARALAPLDAL